jgi:hypothetical protein
MKHLHNVFNKANVPWVKMVWEFYYSNALPPAKTMDVSLWWWDCFKAYLFLRILIIVM